jgi:glycosyltransferase involved in cell wall biosynthesis
VVTLVFVTNVPAPYKRPRLSALAALDDVDLRVIYANTSTRRHEYDVTEAASYEFEMRRSRRVPVGGGEFMIDAWSLRRFLEIEADAFVVGGWNYLAAWSAVVAGRVRGVPVALVSANDRQHTRFSRVLARPAVRAFDAHFALSTSARDHLIDLGASPETVTVLPNSIDVEAFRDRLDPAEQEALRADLEVEDAFVVLYVGRLSEHKGVHDLIAAVGSLDEPVHLLVVGDGPDRDAFERQASRDLPRRATFVGQIPNEELANYYGLADAFVLPTGGDTWGLVLNEAMACGTPVVTTTAAGAVGDLVRDGETGLVATPGDRAALRDVITRLAGDEELQARMAERGADATSEYTPEAYAQRLKEAVDELFG